ncbi:MAG: DNA-deoxyinosine glycosylase [Gammaproteobacteria bacterium]|nr:DNA-deoxyinosine glycosylase [Gammaproteobacteria bacterium]MDH3362529.1 DNA-deoxyinosine glycosylase [Gammaproteobacteria bacterium]MDH3480323.1 DNA-deoxyinosine glycosylase [Gammaproteobacteria bacterium]
MAAIAAASKPSEGFPPIAGPDARILILGSLPGQRSIAEQQYYAHPRNAFWPIMQELFGIKGDFAIRCQQLVENRIALWDVLQSSLRRGSMDANIRMDSARANDFGTFLRTHSEIGLIAFNGSKAKGLFKKYVNTSVVGQSICQCSLPSTSPAYAAMPFSAKLARWRQVILPEAS